MNYTCINIQGNLISEDVLKKIEQGEASGQTASDFGLDSAANLRNEMEYAWSRIKLDWKYFTGKSTNLPATDPYGTTTTRRWMTGFFSALGFDLVPRKSALTGGNDQSYAISHVAGNIDDLPVHIVGFHDPSNPDKNTIDIRSSGGTSRLSPHATVQEYLNVTEHLYGIAANGNLLRLMRDSGRLVKLTYLEFDLRRMLEEDKYSEFTLLFRLLHASRFPRNQQETESCLLERYYNESIESGNRIRDGLSQAVQKSLLALGNGFLRDEANEKLREKLRGGQQTPADYYRQLRRLVYRLLFLMVAEERDLIYDPAERNPEVLRKKKIYFDYYSISRLRKLSRNRYLFEARYNDIWLGLLRTFTLFSEEARGRHLAIEPLGGDLFDQRAIEDLENCLIGNHLLLECIRDLNEFSDVNGNLVSVNYRSLDVEEFGSVYEGLLDLHPVIEGLTLPGLNMIRFTFHEGTDRKTTASYYTRPDLVNEIMKSAVIPVVEDKLKEAERIANSEWRMANGEGRMVRGEWRMENGEGEMQKYLKNLIINLCLEYVNLSRIAHLAKRDGFSGKDLPIDKLLSQRRIVWDDFSTPSGRLLSSSQYRGGMGTQQQQGIQQLSADSQRESEGDGNTFALVSPDRTLYSGADSTYDGLVVDPGQADTLLSKIHLSEKDRVLIWNRLPASIRYSLLAHHQLLHIKVCDPAAGSGHFLLATARTLAWYHARVTSGEENPAPVVFRASLRQVIQHCIYGVDLNPDAVELCKLALWIESHDSGKPLSFLDHKIRCGNSLVGVTDLTILQKGIPDEAFDPVTGDDRTVARTLKRDNGRFRSFLSGRSDTAFQQQLDFGEAPVSHKYVTGMREVEQISQDSLDAVHRVRQRFEKMRSDREWFRDWEACNLWTAAFFFTYTPETRMAAPTSEHLHKYLNHPTAVPGQVIGKADGLASKNRFFHWPLEFPEIFDPASGNSGFDVMVGNPPWERIKLQQQEFFAVRDRDIANAPNAAARNRMIEELQVTNPLLWREYQEALHTADSTGKFLRNSGRNDLTAVGDINTYSVFAELLSSMIGKLGKTGFIVPTGIATDDSNKAFFGAMVERNRLVSLFDFENREKIFKDVDSRYKFCLLTLQGSDRGKEKASFGFFLTRVEHLQDKLRVFSLSREDFLRLNPNTKTCPVFRTSVDAALTTDIYRRVPVLINETTGENPWGVSFMRMFDMSNDSHLFRTRPQLEAEGFTLWGNKMVKKEQRVNGEWRVANGKGLLSSGEQRTASGEQRTVTGESQMANGESQMANGEGQIVTGESNVANVEGPIANDMQRTVSGESNMANGEWRITETWLPLYEAKMIWHYDHRFGTYKGVDSRTSTQTPTPTLEQYQNPNFQILPWYWVEQKNVLSQFITIDSKGNVIWQWNKKWILAFRDITNSTNERTAILTVEPQNGVGNNNPILSPQYNGLGSSLLQANFSSLIFDFPTRHKIAGTHMNFFYVNQLPVLKYTDYRKEETLLIVKRQIELTYTSWDIKAFADDVWKEAEEELKAAIRKQWEENKAATGGHEWDPPEWLEANSKLQMANSEEKAANGDWRIANSDPLATDHSPLASNNSPHENHSPASTSHSPACPLPPFKWDEERRAILKAELDAIYARLYGLNRKQLRYILDPADLTPRELENILDPWEEVTNPLDPEGYSQRSAQSTFPGETFRVLKEKDIRQFGEYRTRRLVLEAWERQNKS